VVDVASHNVRDISNLLPNGMLATQSYALQTPYEHSHVHCNPRIHDSDAPTSFHAKSSARVINTHIVYKIASYSF
jgi:hypothetical protein